MAVGESVAEGGASEVGTVLVTSSLPTDPSVRTRC
jgi:hypothetical protein